MKTLFDPDGPLFRLLARLAELMVLNVCFLICCLPVFTIGASVTGLYAALFSQQEGGAIRRYFRGFRQNFRQGVALELILGAIGALLLLDYQLLEQLDDGYLVVKYLLYLAAITWVGVCSFTFGLAARFKDTVGRILKNAFLLCFSMLPRTVLMVLIDASPIILLLLAPDWFGQYFILWLLVGFAFCAQVKVWVLRDCFASLPEKTQNGE